MKAIALFLLLAISPLIGQATSDDCCNKCRSEHIPHNAVEPATKGGDSYCPRADYELHWYVVENTTSNYYGGGLVYYTSNNGLVSFRSEAKTYLVFKPMCIPAPVSGFTFTTITGTTGTTVNNR